MREHSMQEYSLAAAAACGGVGVGGGGGGVALKSVCYAYYMLRYFVLSLLFFFTRIPLSNA